MKKSDIAMIILIASLSVMMAYFVVGAIPALQASSEPKAVKTIEKYDSEVSEPDETIFNSRAINPTVDVTIGDDR